MLKVYKTVHQDFYGRDFLISKDTLIPRPETEQLIDAILNLAGKPYLPGVKPASRVLPENPVILDVGTGTGCIAITVKKELPESKVYALDISEKALNIAKCNAEDLEAEIEFRKSDLLENAKDLAPDLTVANLPYVDESWDWIDKKALSKEPSLALYADDHGLALIKKLIDQIKSSAHKPQYLLLEADPCQHEDIIKYAKEKGFTFHEARGFALVFSRS